MPTSVIKASGVCVCSHKSIYVQSHVLLKLQDFSRVFHILNLNLTDEGVVAGAQGRGFPKLIDL